MLWDSPQLLFLIQRLIPCCYLSHVFPCLKRFHGSWGWWQLPGQIMGCWPQDQGTITFQQWEAPSLAKKQRGSRNHRLAFDGSIGNEQPCDVDLGIVVVSYARCGEDPKHPHHQKSGLVVLFQIYMHVRMGQIIFIKIGVLSFVLFFIFFCSWGGMTVVFKNPWAKFLQNFATPTQKTT